MISADHWPLLDPFAPPPLEGQGTHVWLVPLPAPVCWDEILLPAQDLALLAEIRAEVRAREFRRLRACLRTLLRAYAGNEAAGSDFRFGPHGKPELPGCPVHFNLTHCRDLALLAFSRQGPVGVDIERMDRPAKHADLADRYCHPAERARMQASVNPSETFMRIWTAKEAWLKARGWGISLPLAEMDTGRMCPDLSLHALPLGPNWTASLVHAGGPVLCCSTPSL